MRSLRSMKLQMLQRRGTTLLVRSTIQYVKWIAYSVFCSPLAVRYKLSDSAALVHG